MRRFVRFLSYNNIVPIAVSFMLLGAASTYAATNPEVVLDKQEEVISIDNTYIASVDFKKYSPSIKIVSVTEDDLTYFVTYEFSTISLADAVWQDVKFKEVMEIAKKSLGGYRDLGLYVTQELNEKLASEVKRLKETQTFEKKTISSKKITTKYKGIVGGFLSEKETTLGKYKPVVKPPKREKEVQTFARPDPNAKPKVVPPKVKIPVVAEAVVEDVVATGTDELIVNDEVATGTEDVNTEDDTNTGDDTEITNESPTLTILGDNPVRIKLGKTYTDLGAAVTDDHDTDLTVDVYVDGVAVTQVLLDTSTTTTYSIVYESLDSGGMLAQEERTVEVYDPSTEGSGNGNAGGGGGSDNNGGAEASTTTSDVVEEETPTTTPDVVEEVPVIEEEKASTTPVTEEVSPIEDVETEVATSPEESPAETPPPTESATEPPEDESTQTGTST